MLQRNYGIVSAERHSSPLSEQVWHERRINYVPDWLFDTLWSQARIR